MMLKPIATSPGQSAHFTSAPSPVACAFRKRLIVARTVAAGPVVRLQHPPAMVFKHVLDLHFQMPPAKRFTLFFPQKLQRYLVLCWISYRFTIFLSEAP